MPKEYTDESSHSAEVPPSQVSSSDPSSPELTSTPSSSSHLPSPTPLPTKTSDAESPIGGRLDTALRSLYQLSNKGARKLISTGKVSVSEVVCDRWETPVALGEKITVNPSAPNPAKHVALGATLVYQDTALAVLSKPAGLLSAPGHDSDEESALQAASRLCRGPRRPRVVHRLDKETSGLLLFARTIPATRQLQASIQSRQVKRVYRCLVRGEVQGEGSYLSSLLVRDAGKGKRGSRAGSLKVTKLNKAPPREPTPPIFSEDAPHQPRTQWALTRYRVIARHAGFSALEVELFTGRTHQIRIHLSEIGHPIVGEWVYAPRIKREPRLALHAARLTLPHPFSETLLEFEAPWPDELAEHKGTPSAWMSAAQLKKRSDQSRPKRASTTKRPHTAKRPYTATRTAHPHSDSKRAKTAKKQRDTKG